MKNYDIQYKNELGEWETISNLGQDLSTLNNLTEVAAMQEFTELMNIFDDQTDYRMVDRNDNVIATK